MKKVLLNIFLVALTIGLSIPATAQVVTPAASPTAELSEMVGLTNVKINYSRPGVKGRTIFAADGLVPFGKIWRTGANSATSISFDKDVTFGGKDLKAGKYAILSVPAKDKWEVQVYAFESGSWASYVDKEPTAKFMVEAQSFPMAVETLTFMVQNVSSTGAAVVLVWENTMVAMPLEVGTEKEVMASIESAMSGPSANDYFQAAVYYHEAGKDLKQALKWIQKANAENPRFWMVRREALIQADLGMKKEAIETAKKSLEMAKEAGNDDYIRMNEKSIKEWSM